MIFYFASEKYLYIILLMIIHYHLQNLLRFLVEILTTESQNTIKWFSENKVIVNPDKFKSSFIYKSSQTSKPKQFFIGNDVVEVASSVKLLGKHIDDQLSFNLHINNTINMFPSNLMLL